MYIEGVFIMRAIVFKKDKTFYESIVFAIEYERDKQYPEYISTAWYYLMDEDYNLVRLSELVSDEKQQYKQVFIRNVQSVNSVPWIKEKDIEGYPRFIHNERLISQIKNGETVDESIRQELEWLNEGNLYAYKNELNDNSVDSKSDIDDLMEFTMWFHDGHVENIEKGNDSVIFTLSGVWGFKTFKLIFKGHVFSFFEDDLDELWFTGASLFIDKDRQICFATDEGHDNKKELEGFNGTHIFADSLRFEYEFDLDWEK